MSTWDEMKAELDQQRQDQLNTAMGYQRKPKNPFDPGYNVREELANSFRPKSYADRFNDYMNKRFDARMASATRSSDPDLAELDRQEAEARQGIDSVNRNAIDELRQNVEKHTVDPKRQRWSAIASAATDAVSGIAGMIGVANGAVHPASLSSIPAASKVSSDHYESERQKRQKALAELHDADMKRYKDKLTSISELRKRIYEDRLRPYREQQERQKARLNQQQVQNAIYQGQRYQEQTNYERERARREGIDADYRESYNKATIAAKNRSNTGASKSAKTAKDGHKFKGYGRSLAGFTG